MVEHGGTFTNSLQQRDRSKLPMRCDQAEQAINERFRELLEKPSEDNTDERLALAKAILSLRRFPAATKLI
jgi:hypothetical protein